jgi:two-component system chemotaxis response regulator CheY
MDVLEQIRKSTILIVQDIRTAREDGRTIQNILQHIFRVQGFENLSRASSEKEAMRIINNETVHLVLTDWIMPKESGLSFVKKIRAEEPELSIIIVTGMASKKDVLEALAAGINDYILKPLVPKEVLQKSIKQLEQREVREL